MPRTGKNIDVVATVRSIERGNGKAIIGANRGYEFEVPSGKVPKSVQAGVTVQVTINKDHASRLGEERVQATAVSKPIEIGTARVPTREGG